ncbi:MAG: hypothetical protein ACUVTP_01120 [Candidatus Fervidibacter sp.]
MALYNDAMMRRKRQLQHHLQRLFNAYNLRRSCTIAPLRVEILTDW